MDSAFKSTALLPPHVVFGLTLKEFTLGHWFLLHDVGSAFATGDGLLIDDLVLASFICGQPHQEARKAVNKWSTPIFLKLWGWINRKANLALEISKFCAYLRESQAAPKSDPIGPVTHEVTTPQHWRMWAMLIFDAGMTPEAALDMPLRTAFCLWAAEADRRGLAKSGDSQRIEELKKYAAEQDALKAKERQASG